jgi:hypothetical protein
MTENKKISGFEPLLQLVKSGKIDGFYVVKDNLIYVANHPWVEDLNLIRYEAPGGELLLRRGRFSRYGYETEEDFVHDCKHGLLECRTTPGAITLGASRRIAGKSIQVFLYGTGLNAAPSFLADSPGQAKSIKQILENAYPGATVRILDSASLFSLERFSPVNNARSVRHLFNHPDANVRKWFRLFAGVTVLSALTTLLDVMEYISMAASWISIIAFMLTFVVFINVGKVANSATAPPPAQSRRRKKAKAEAESEQENSA